MDKNKVLKPLVKGTEDFKASLKKNPPNQKAIGGGGNERTIATVSSPRIEPKYVEPPSYNDDRDFFDINNPWEITGKLATATAGVGAGVKLVPKVIRAVIPKSREFRPSISIFPKKADYIPEVKSEGPSMTSRIANILKKGNKANNAPIIPEAAAKYTGMNYTQAGPKSINKLALNTNKAVIPRTGGAIVNRLSGLGRNVLSRAVSMAGPAELEGMHLMAEQLSNLRDRISPPSKQELKERSQYQKMEAAKQFLNKEKSRVNNMLRDAPDA